MTAPLYVDISTFQPKTIDWKAYVAWAKQWDGFSRVALRSSYGTGYTDDKYRDYLRAARDAGIDQVIHYHYAYPQFNPRPEDEADWQAQVVGALGVNDLLMLDFEENATKSTNAEWALGWLRRQEENYNQIPTIYASMSMVVNRLQDSALARYPLILAYWNYDQNKPPTSPGPWPQFLAWQFSDKLAGVPGFGSALVDANVYYGGAPMAKTNNGVVFDLRQSFQLDGGSEMKCGPWSTAELKYAGPPTLGPRGSAAEVRAWANAEYEKYIGPDIPSNPNGSSIENMHQFLTDAKLHWRDITAINPSSSRSNDIARINKALDAGYPVLVTVNEQSVIRPDGTNPYPWQPRLGPANHIFTIVGHTSDGFFLANDELNEGDAWPNKYKQSALEIHWASIVQMVGDDPANPWLKPTPSEDPLNWPGGFNAQNASLLGAIMGIPKGWRLSTDGKTLTASNNVNVVLGFMAYILNAPSWDSGNVPMAPQKHVNTVQYHSTSFGEGDVQYFRDGMFWYTKSKGVIKETQLGAELYAMLQLLEQKDAEKAVLTAQIATQTEAITTLTAQLAACLSSGAGGITPELQAVINTGMATLKQLSQGLSQLEDQLQPYVTQEGN